MESQGTAKCMWHANEPMRKTWPMRLEEERRGGCKRKARERETIMSSDIQRNGKEETGYIPWILTEIQVVI